MLTSLRQTKCLHNKLFLAIVVEVNGNSPISRIRDCGNESPILMEYLGQCVSMFFVFVHICLRCHISEN